MFSNGLRLVSVFIGSCLTCYAQSSTAQLSGTVSDAQGALVAHAMLRVINTGTAVARTLSSNDTGSYLATSLAPGEYRIEVVKSGFQRAVSQVIHLDVNQAATLDIQLKLGQVSESVEVSANATLLQTSDAQLGTVVTQERIADLPLNGRNFTQLLTLTAGAAPVSVAQNASGGNVQKIGTIVFPAVNGQSNRSNTFTLDGVFNDSNWNGTYAIAPSVDALAEFKVQSHSDQAEFGGVTGGVVNIATKSGTNQWHGTVYEFLRNDALDARGFFTASKPPLRQNQFGATLGGRVIKDKTFFFVSYESYRQQNQSSSLYIVPTPAQLGGNFSGSKPIYNPFTTRQDPANPNRTIRDLFANNIIPVSMLDKADLAWAQAIIPAPTNTGNPTFNGRNVTSQSFPGDQYSVRLDHNFSPNNSLWGRYTWGTQDQQTAGTLQGTSSSTHIPARNAGLNYTHVFSGSTVFNSLFGYTSLESDSVPFLTKQNLFESAPFQGFPSKAGLNAPGVTIPSAFTAGSRIDYLGPAEGYQFRLDLSHVTGRHSLKFGGGLVQQAFHDNTYDGNFGFNALQTANLNSPGTTGSDIASFVLGTMDSWEYRDRRYDYRSQLWNAYAEDSWKVTDRLTVNVGLRWDLLRNPSFSTNYPSTWDFNDGKFIVGSTRPPDCGANQSAPCLPDPANPYISQHVIFTGSSKIRNDDYKMFGPRAGVAYRVGKATVVRAGFGIFYDLQAGVMQQAQNASGAWPRTDLIRGTNLNRTTVQALVDNPFNGADPRIPLSTPATASAYFFDPKFQNPYSEQWNVEVQNSVTPTIVASLGYVGSHDSRLPVGGFYNTALQPGPGPIAARALWPYAPVTNYDRSIGRSSYQALQAKLDKRFSHGFSLLAAYTWSKSIDLASSGQFGVEGESLQNPYNVDADRSASGYDIPHNFSLGMSYVLPFGHGQRWLTQGFASRLFGNWQLNALALLRSGQPYSVTMSTDVANIGAATTRPNLVGEPALANPSPQAWFNTAAFASPAVYTFGNSGRNQLRTQSYRDLDLSLFRQDQITERIRTELRIETFNLTNTPTFGVPNTNFNSSAFGVISSTVSTARQIQLGFKILF